MNNKNRTLLRRAFTALLIVVFVVIYVALVTGLFYESFKIVAGHLT